MQKPKAGAEPPRKPRADPEAEAVPGFLLTPSRRRRMEADEPTEGLSRLALSRTRGAEPTD